MGSGCGNSKTTGRCNSDQITSSHCVNWQGDAYEKLGVCTGDTLTEVGDVVLKKLEQFAKGESININDLTVGCDNLEVKLKNTDKSLYSILKLVLEENCSLEESISKLDAKIDKLSITVDNTKLCPDAKTPTEIQQCIIDSIVDVKKSLENLSKNLGDVSSENNTIVENISNTIGNFLLSSLSSCNGGIEQTGTGKNAKINLLGINPPGAYLWGEFDISKFDSTGLGTDLYCGYALANGRNGTIDMRNRIPSMAAKIQGVTRTFEYLTNYGDIRGADRITLSPNQIPDHEHILEDPGHDHDYKYQGGSKSVGKNVGGGEPAGNTNNVDGKTLKSYTNLKVKGVKGTHSQPIDIRQNTVYLVWVKRVVGFKPVSTQNSQFNLNLNNIGITNE